MAQREVQGEMLYVQYNNTVYANEFILMKLIVDELPACKNQQIL